LGGHLSRQQIDNTVSAAGDRFAGCLGGYDQATINVSTVIASNGQVVKASASRSAPDDARMRDCAMAQFKTLTFPGTGSDSDTAFTLELLLQKSSRVGAGRRGAQRPGLSVSAKLK
jgi:hypothetical protein